MTYETDLNSYDKRSLHSRNAIRDAFVELVLTERYDDIKVSDIITRSGVARSTFYQHFVSKDAILANSLIPPMSRLASAVLVEADLKPIEDILLHFWDKRSFCRLILQGRAGKAVSECLTELLTENITKQIENQQAKLLIQVELLAIQISEAQLALLRTWLSGKAQTKAETLACAIKNTSAAMLSSLLINES